MNTARLRITSIGVTLFTVLSLLTSALPASAITSITPTPAGPFVFEAGEAISNITFAEAGANGATTYSVTPDLPTGLSINTADGTISGIPTTATGQSVYVVEVDDAENSAISILTITVIDDPTATTAAASDISGVSAVLNGNVAARFSSTLVRFCISPNANLLGCSYVTATQSPVTGNTSTNVSATATGLTAATQYFFRVETQNNASAPSWVEGTTLNFTTLAQSAPGVPQNLTQEAVGSGAIDLDWDAPASTGGSAITDYVIQQSTDNGSNWNTITDGVSTTTSYSVTGLTPSTQYQFRVAAKNVVGTGSYTAATAQIYPRTEPGAPTAVTGISGSASVILSWTAPASNGGASISDYVIQRSTDNGSNWTTVSDTVSTNTSLTISDLNNGQSYVFRVAAVNTVGTGNYSANSAAITVGAPNAPTNLIGTVGNTQVRLDWNAPSLTGGASITDYVVQFSSNTGTTWTTFADGTSTASEATVTGLTNGTSYVFRVAAVNSRGQGAYSATSAAVVPAPNPPTVTAVTPVSGPLAGGTTVTITGTNLTGATVTFGGTAGTNVVVNATGTSLTVVTPTRPAGAVSVVVNTLGGTTTAAATFTYIAAPTAPTAVGAVAGVNSALVSWTAVAGATSYAVTSNPAGATCTVTGTTANCTNLVAGASYTFTVTATNAGGTSPASVASNVAIPKAPTITKTRKITINFAPNSVVIPAVKISAIRTVAAQITVDEGTQVRIAINGFTKPTGATASELAFALTRAKAVRKAARTYGLAGTYTLTNTGKSKTVAKAQRVVMTVTWVTQSR